MIWPEMANEFRRIFSLKPVLSVMVLGVLFYAAFYPQPYVNEVLRNVPIALIDQDGTVASRDLARRIDASADVAIAGSFADLPTAEREVFSRQIFGIVVIPKNFESELLHGRASPVALYADASYFLIYQRLAGAVTSAARTLGSEVELNRLVGAGIDPDVAQAAADPLRLTVVPLFNPQGGYATYLLPAAFVLILQQTLMMGVALLGTMPNNRGALDTLAPPALAAALAGRLMAYLALEALIIPFYLIVLPHLYGLPRLGGVPVILAFALPLVLAVCALAMLLAVLMRKPLTVQLVSATLGLPFFFLSGFAWPAAAIPQAVRWGAVLVPSSLAIDGFVRISQMGATLSDVSSQFTGLWALFALYMTLTLVAVSLRRRRRS